MYVTGVTFLMDNISEDQYIRSYVCHCCYCHRCYLPYGNTSEDHKYDKYDAVEVEGKTIVLYMFKCSTIVRLSVMP